METKGPDSAELFPGILELKDDGFPEIAAYIKVMRLKRLYRQGWLRSGLSPEKCESVADHAFGCAILAFFLASNEEKPGKMPKSLDIMGTGIDRIKVILMALIHELGEVYAGDITPYDGITREEKVKRERESLVSLVSDIPDLMGIKSLWEEYEAGKSAEARFVKSIDKLEMGIQAKVYKSEGMEGAEDFFESVRSALGDSPLIAAITK